MQWFSFKKGNLKILYLNCCPFCSGLIVLDIWHDPLPQVNLLVWYAWCLSGILKLFPALKLPIFMLKDHGLKGLVNSLAPGRFWINLTKIIFKLILVTDGCDISSKIALRWTSMDLSDDESTLVQEMAWCHQATGHYLSQCWLSPWSPYGVARPQWVKDSEFDNLW